MFFSAQVFFFTLFSILDATRDGPKAPAKETERGGRAAKMSASSIQCCDWPTWLWRARSANHSTESRGLTSPWLVLLEHSLVIIASNGPDTEVGRNVSHKEINVVVDVVIVLLLCFSCYNWVFRCVVLLLWLRCCFVTIMMLVLRLSLHSNHYAQPPLWPVGVSW